MHEGWRMKDDSINVQYSRMCIFTTRKSSHEADSSKRLDDNTGAVYLWNIVKIYRHILLLLLPIVTPISVSISDLISNENLLAKCVKCVKGVGGFWA